jgi:hypothetical protein
MTIKIINSTSKISINGVMLIYGAASSLVDVDIAIFFIPFRQQAQNWILILRSLLICS